MKETMVGKAILKIGLHMYKSVDLKSYQSKFKLVAKPVVKGILYEGIVNTILVIYNNVTSKYSCGVQDKNNGC